MLSLLVDGLLFGISDGIEVILIDELSLGQAIINRNVKLTTES